MAESKNVNALFNSPFINKEYYEADHPGAYPALPDTSLEFLAELCKITGIKKIFEFGSGRSTKAFLNAGCSVVSVEDNDFWMNETVKTLDDKEKSNFKPLVKPLKTRRLGYFLVKDWDIDAELSQCLNDAELILVDSPYYAPFRESTLWSSLTYGNGALIILDDTRVHTLSGFCNRLSESNSFLKHKRVKVGHGFDLFYKEPGNSSKSLKLNHSFIDFMKGWKRYFSGLKYYSELKKN